MADLPSAPVLAARGMMALSGTLLLLLSIGGVVLASRGHAPPSHPYAEVTLGALAVSSFLGAASFGRGSRAGLVAGVIAGVLATVGALLWASSAFLALSSG